jgi:cell division protein FtsB
MGNWQDMLPQLTRLPDPQEIQRLRLLHEGAVKQLQKVESDKERDQLDSAQGRVGFFDKLTIGAGATIAALVSFLGAHSSKLQPAWILRGALFFLALTMVAALFRNFRYPNYVLQIHKISWIRCTRYEQQCRLNYIKADPTVVSITTGEPIDVATLVEECKKSETEIEQLDQESARVAERLRKQWAYAESLCISFACIAVILLLWLAFVNF